MRRSFLALPLMMLSLVVMPCCGSDSTTAPSEPPPTTAPPLAQANITATGNGVLVVHPSVGSTFAVAMETPIRIQETAGGTADWNFARFSLFLNGAEVERGEIGSNTISSAGFSRIAANSTVTPTLIFRFNAANFTSVTITLGFGDVNRGGTFEVQIPFGSFTGVTGSTVPIFAPENRVEPQ